MLEIQLLQSFSSFLPQLERVRGKNLEATQVSSIREATVKMARCSESECCVLFIRTATQRVRRSSGECAALPISAGLCTSVCCVQLLVVSSKLKWLGLCSCTAASARYILTLARYLLSIFSGYDILNYDSV